MTLVCEPFDSLSKASKYFNITIFTIKYHLNKLTVSTKIKPDVLFFDYKLTDKDIVDIRNKLSKPTKKLKLLGRHL